MNKKSTFIIKFISLAFLLFISLPPYHGETSEIFTGEYDTTEGVYIHKSTSQLRSTFSSSIERIIDKGRVTYKLIQQGEGNYDKYEGVTWEINADMEEKEGFLYPIRTSRIIRDKDKNIIIKYKKYFDYDKQRIYYTASDREDNIVKRKIFPIKGKTADNNTLIYFLKPFLAHLNEKPYRNFYLVSSEPRLYRINIRDIGLETLKSGKGTINTIKLRLIPDLGLLTGLSGAFIPPTYIWYTEKSPFIWLRYEGLETGLGSSHVIAYVSED